MEPHPFRVDFRMIPPVVLSIAFGCILLVLEGPTRRGLLLAALLAPFFYLAAEILARKVVVDPSGITISKLFRSVRHEWSDISSVDAVQTGAKMFIILHSDKGGTTLITNTIRPFDKLAAAIMESAPRGSIAEGAKEHLVNPPTKVGPLFQAWIACLVLGALAIGTLLGYG